MLHDVVRVFHCDDSSSFRVLVREVLAEHEDVEVVGEAGSPAQALERVVASAPDVVLLDLLPPDAQGDLVTELGRRVPAARIVVYSGYPVSISEQRHAGASAYLQKSAPMDELYAVIRATAAAAGG